MTLKAQNAPIQILLADDDLDDRLFFERALKALPIATQLITVIDGEELMKYLFEHSEDLPAILFLDLSMPRKTGFECLAEIKENDKLKDIPVIVFTISAGQNIQFEQSLINTLSSIGSQKYVRKPTDNKQLQQIIHQALTTEMEKLPEVPNTIPDQFLPDTKTFLTNDLRANK